MGALSAPDYRGQKLNPGSLGKLNDLIHHLIHRLLLDFPPAFRTMGNADPSIKEPEIIIDLRYSPYSRTGVPVGGLLINRDCRGQSFYALYIRLFHLPQELAGIGRKRFHISSLAFCVNGIKGQGAFAGSAESC